MYSPPTEPDDERRMRRTLHQCAAALGVTVTGPEVWGWHGRTLSSAAQHPDHGRCWLRLLSAPEDKAEGKIWEGNRAAASLFDGRVHKPVLHAANEEVHAGHAFQAELSQYVDEPVCAPEPFLRTDLDLSAAWWASLRTDLETIADTHTDRVAVRQEWVDRSVPRFLGITAPKVTDWTTAHGDMHAANLTSATPYLLDWEGFGRAPVGYDAAMLLAYSLLVPDFAQRVRETFPVLKSEAGRTAQIIVITELIQSATRGDHPELVPALRTLVSELA
jgi:hypothetical protein